jgi:hypothetical protein
MPVIFKLFFVESLHMPEKSRRKKFTWKRPSFWVAYSIALPLVLAFMFYEILQAVG